MSLLLKQLESKGYSLRLGVRQLADNDPEGVWRTINGRAIFIRKGQSLDEAMKGKGAKGSKWTDSAPKNKNEPISKEKVRESMRDRLKDRDGPPEPKSPGEGTHEIKGLKEHFDTKLGEFDKKYGTKSQISQRTLTKGEFQRMNYKHVTWDGPGVEIQINRPEGMADAKWTKIRREASKLMKFAPHSSLGAEKEASNKRLHMISMANMKE